MSTNLHLRAHRKITVQATGKEELQYIYRDLWQTPSAVSRAIRESTRDTLEMYKEYVMSISSEQTELQYHEDDWMHEGEPVGTQKYRIKLEPKPDVVRYIHITKERSVDIATYFPSAWVGAVLEVTLDGETGEIKHSKKYEGDFND